MNGLQMPKIKRMKNVFLKRSLALAVVWMLAGACPLIAGYEYKFDNKTNPMGEFESEITGKLTRGMVNLIYGWTEIARTPINMSQGPKKNFLKTTLIGVPYGILRAGARTVLGVYEIVTCWAPQKPIMEPIEGEVR